MYNIDGSLKIFFGEGKISPPQRGNQDWFLACGGGGKMRCPNPACQCELFKVRVVWKQRIKELPTFLPVALTCSKCGRQIKAYVLNENLKQVYLVLQSLQEGQSSIINRIQQIESEIKGRRFKGILKRLKLQT